MRSTLLPGLFRVAQRNAGRGFADLALFESGHAFRANPAGGGVAPVLAVDHGPSLEETGRVDATLPDQARLVSCVLTGELEPGGWWGSGRQAGFYDAIEAAHTVLRASRVPYQVRAAQQQPWHPGRCAEFLIDVPSEPGVPGVPGVPGEPDAQTVVGYAGELHPRVISAFKLAPRTCAMELDFTAIERAAAGLPPVQAPVISGYPMATQDVALVVPESVPAAEVAAALTAGASGVGVGGGAGGASGAGSAGSAGGAGGASGAGGAGEAGAGGSLLEDVRLFDVYAGEQIGAGHKSLAYTLRFRAPDRTLTDEEVAVARDAAVAEATRRCGAVLRSG
jgi:phenylalanyl-tRNA synthetase beta chain